MKKIEEENLYYWYNQNRNCDFQHIQTDWLKALKVRLRSQSAEDSVNETFISFNDSNTECAESSNLKFTPLDSNQQNVVTTPTVPNNTPCRKHSFPDDKYDKDSPLTFNNWSVPFKSDKLKPSKLSLRACQRFLRNSDSPVSLDRTTDIAISLGVEPDQSSASLSSSLLTPIRPLPEREESTLLKKKTYFEKKLDHDSVSSTDSSQFKLEVKTTGEQVDCRSDYCTKGTQGFDCDQTILKDKLESIYLDEACQQTSETAVLERESSEKKCILYTSTPVIQRNRVYSKNFRKNYLQETLSENERSNSFSDIVQAVSSQNDRIESLADTLKNDFVECCEDKNESVTSKKPADTSRSESLDISHSSFCNSNNNDKICRSKRKAKFIYPSVEENTEYNTHNSGFMIGAVLGEKTYREDKISQEESAIKFPKVVTQKNFLPACKLPEQSLVEVKAPLTEIDDKTLKEKKENSLKEQGRIEIMNSLVPICSESKPYNCHIVPELMEIPENGSSSKDPNFTKSITCEFAEDSLKNLVSSENSSPECSRRFQGFCNAAGKNVSVSGTALESIEKSWKDRGEEKVKYTFSPVDKSTNKLEMKAAGLMAVDTSTSLKINSVCEEVSVNSQKCIPGSESREENCLVSNVSNNNNNNRSNVDQQKFTVNFKTASDKHVKINQTSLKTVKKIWDDIEAQDKLVQNFSNIFQNEEESKSSESKIMDNFLGDQNPGDISNSYDNKTDEEPYNMKLCKGSKTNYSSYELGFKTANNKIVNIDSESLKKAKALWDEVSQEGSDDISRCKKIKAEKIIWPDVVGSSLNSVSNQKENVSPKFSKLLKRYDVNHPTTVEFRTASNKKVKIDSESLITAKSLWNDTEEPIKQNDDNVSKPNSVISEEQTKTSINQGSLLELQDPVEPLSEENLKYSQLGFLTASNKHITISSGSLSKAKKLWEDSLQEETSVQDDGKGKCKEDTTTLDNNKNNNNNYINKTYCSDKVIQPKESNKNLELLTSNNNIKIDSASMLEGNTVWSDTECQVKNINSKMLKKKSSHNEKLGLEGCCNDNRSPSPILGSQKFKPKTNNVSCKRRLSEDQTEKTFKILKRDNDSPGNLKSLHSMESINKSLIPGSKGDSNFLEDCVKYEKSLMTNSGQDDKVLDTNENVSRNSCNQDHKNNKEITKSCRNFERDESLLLIDEKKSRLKNNEGYPTHIENEALPLKEESCELKCREIKRSDTEENMEISKIMETFLLDSSWDWDENSVKATDNCQVLQRNCKKKISLSRKGLNPPNSVKAEKMTLRKQQQEIIQKKMTEPYKSGSEGTLFQMKQKNREKRVKLSTLSLSKVAIKEDLTALKVTSQNSIDYKFDSGNVWCTKLEFDDGIDVIPRDDGSVGWEEIEAGFLSSPEVNAAVVPNKWVPNHFSLIVWKLAAVQTRLGNQFKQKPFTLEEVIRQIRYRYDVEIIGGKRSVIRKICEQDDIPQKTMVLCVSNINVQLKGLSPLKDLNKSQNSYFQLMLTDGWYSVGTHVDEAMLTLIHRRVVRIGTKLLIHGAELMGNPSACHPLQASGLVQLKIHTNMTRLAAWYTKLGLVRSMKLPLPTLISSAFENGGLVGTLEVVLCRKYPVVYLVKKGDKTSIINNRVNESRRRSEEARRDSVIQEIYMQVEQEINATEEIMERTSLPSRLEDIRNLSDGQQLSNLIESGDSHIIQVLSKEQIDTAAKWKQDSVYQKRQKINRAVSSRIKKIATSEVVPMLKIGVADKNDFKGIITIWRAQEELVASLVEGQTYRFHYLQSSPVRNEMKQFSWTKQTLIRPGKEHNMNTFPRSCFSPSSFSSFSGEVNSSWGEVDMVGIVVDVSEPRGGTQTAFLADHNKVIVGLRFAPSINEFGYDDLMKEGSIICASNCAWKHLCEDEIFIFHVTPYTLLSSTSKHKHFEDALSSLKDELQVMKTQSFITSLKKVLNERIRKREQCETSNEFLESERRGYNSHSSDTESRLHSLKKTFAIPSLKPLPGTPSPILNRPFRTPLRDSKNLS